MSTSPARPARLVLEDGTILQGRSFGATETRIGELVFNTSMTGYQEILTDPSYRGQTVLFTQPHIGNQGINSEDEESTRPWLSGVVVREVCRHASNFRSAGELGDYLIQHGIPAIEQIDTRLVTRRVRKAGALRVLITHDQERSPEELLAQVRAGPHIGDDDHVAAVTTARIEHWTRGDESPFSPPRPEPKTRETLEIIAFDLGIKRSILRSLVQSGFDVTLVPAQTPAEVVLERAPRGVFLSNGPGDPSVIGPVVENVKKLVQRLPVFGICLGHQVLARVFGAETFKMKFGHHGANQPVMDLQTEKVEITAQNHSFAVDANKLPAEISVTHVNLNDRTIEGLAHRELPVFSVQYHPEAAPGPHDALHLFERFREQIQRS